jgi:hypothetical protein
VVDVTAAHDVTWLGGYSHGGVVITDAGTGGAVKHLIAVNARRAAGLRRAPHSGVVVTTVNSWSMSSCSMIATSNPEITASLEPPATTSQAR